MPYYRDKLDKLMRSLCFVPRESKTQFMYNPHLLYFEKKSRGLLSGNYGSQ